MGSARPFLALGAAFLISGIANAAPPAKAADDVQQVILNCDAITYQGVLDEKTSKELDPIHTLDGVATVLTKHGIRFDRSKQTVTINLPQAIRTQIDTLPPGEPIVLPAEGGGLVCVLQPSADSV